MKNKVIHAISFLYRGERLVVKPTTFGKFKVPVSGVEGGSLKTKVRSLTAKQVIDHEVIKHCDPTLYLANNERMRVYPGGDPSYLPAQVEGLILKHDAEHKIKLPKIKNKTNTKYSSKYNYEQASLDMYGWYPGCDADGNAD